VHYHLPAPTGQYTVKDAVKFSFTADGSRHKCPRYSFHDSPNLQDLTVYYQITMTPEQRAAFEGTRGGDLVLITTPEGSTTPAYGNARLLLVESVRTVGMRTRRTVYVRGSGSIGSQDWITYQRSPALFWRNFQMGQPVTAIDLLLSDEDQVLSRPTFDDLYHPFFGGDCPFVYCHDGLVNVSSATRIVLRDTAEAARRHGSNMKTICPFCMGTALYRDHEREVERTTVVASSPSTFRHDEEDAIRTEHLGRIHARRSELGYSPLAQDTPLNNLTRETADIILFSVALSDLEHIAALESTSTPEANPEPPDERFTQPMWIPILDTFTPHPEEAPPSIRDIMNNFATNSPPSSNRPAIPHLPLPPPPPVIITAPVQHPGSVTPNFRAREWYVQATSRVLNSVCQICLDKFRQGDVVADLPCWHFFHVACWERVFGGRCPFRCNEGEVEGERGSDD